MMTDASDEARLLTAFQTLKDMMPPKSRRDRCISAAHPLLVFENGGCIHTAGCTQQMLRLPETQGLVMVDAAQLGAHGAACHAHRLLHLAKFLVAVQKLKIKLPLMKFYCFLHVS